MCFSWDFLSLSLILIFRKLQAFPSLFCTAEFGSIESFQSPPLCLYQIKSLYSQGFFFLVFISFKIHKKIYFRPACVALFNLILLPSSLPVSLIPLHLLPFKLTWIFLIFALFLSFSLLRLECWSLISSFLPCASWILFAALFVSVCINHPNSCNFWNHWIILKSLVCFLWKASFRKWDSSPQKSKLWVFIVFK